jgi:pimeloyl-ACP methyl ester carboxylesterase
MSPARVARTTVSTLRPSGPSSTGSDRPVAKKASGWQPFEKVKIAADSFRTAVKQGPGPRIDPFNATKDWMSDRVFNKLAPNQPADQLKGPQRVAYGPLAAPPKLKQPVVMIPGLTMPAQSFDRMGDQLAKEKANGPVVVYVASQDKFRLNDSQGRELTAQEVKDARIFQVEYRDPWASPTEKSPQIARALERISAATASGKVDVVTHSAGGTDFRLYLDGRDAAKGPAIDRAVMIGPASHGTYMGNIGNVVGNPIKNVDDAARELAVGSKMITDLNTSWDRQRAQLPGGVTIIGTTGTPTLGPKKGVFEDGDGYMPTASLPMPGAKTVLLEGPHNTPLAHLWQVQYSGVVNAAFDVLGR